MIAQVRFVPVSIPRGSYEGATWMDVLALSLVLVALVGLIAWSERPTKKQRERGAKALRDFQAVMASQGPAFAPLPMSDSRVPFDDLDPVSS